MGLDDDVAFHSNIPETLDITVAVVYSVFGLCSLLGNSVLLYVSYKKRHLLKPAEYFIINLAVSDLGLTLSLYPMAIMSSLSHRWLYGKTACALYAFCGMLFGLCSLTTLTLLSMVCFVKVCYPQYGNRFSTVHSYLLIACAWVYALLFACSPLVHWGEYGPEPYGTACCIDWRLSNEHTTARSYTVALFIFCYILPCCVIVASYTGILVTVQASRKTIEQHVSRQTHMSSIQLIIVKLSVAICIGFFAAWSPYAVVSMWASFGHIDDIPPLAFAMPAMFAKSSTIYNPIIYLMLRPTFRKVMARDLAALCHVCLRGCSPRCCSQPRIRFRFHLIHRQTDQLPPTNSTSLPSVIALKDHPCDPDPHRCGLTHSSANPDPSTRGDQVLRSQRNAQALRCVCSRKCGRSTSAKQTSEIDNLHINFQMVPGHTKVAWP